jgi:hypothetical protein
VLCLSYKYDSPHLKRATNTLSPNKLHIDQSWGAAEKAKNSQNPCKFATEISLPFAISQTSISLILALSTIFSLKFYQKFPICLLRAG